MRHAQVSPTMIIYTLRVYGREARGRGKVVQMVLSGQKQKGHRGSGGLVTSCSQMVLDSVPSPHSRRNYAKALDHLFAFCASRPLSRALLMEWRAGMESFAPSTVNVRLSAVRKLVGEARRNGMIGSEEAANLTDIPNIRQQGTRLGNWLTREQAKELLAVPDRSTLKVKRDLWHSGAAGRLRPAPARAANLYIEEIQLRENRWVIADLRGKGGRVRTVAVPVWVKQAVNSWTTAAGLEEGKLLRPVLKSGKVVRESLSDWAVLVRGRAVGQGDRHRTLRSARSAEDLRQALPQERRRSGANQVPARSLFHPDDRTLPRIGAGDRHSGE
jgi:integrase